MAEKTEEFSIGYLQAVCKTNFASPSFAKSHCDVTRDGEFRAAFDFDVEAGKVLKADATLSKEILNELKPESGSEKEVADLKDFMQKRNLDKITLTVLESESDIKKAQQTWEDVASKF